MPNKEVTAPQAKRHAENLKCLHDWPDSISGRNTGRELKVTSVAKAASVALTAQAKPTSGARAAITFAA